jgi:hypothetical protein
VADAVRRNQSPICVKLPAAENSLASVNLSGKSPDLSFWPILALRKASELSSESEPKGANSLIMGSGNNREVREILLVIHF